MPSCSAWRWAVTLVLAVGTPLSCNALWGIDELEFDGPGAQGGSSDIGGSGGSAGATTSSTSSSGAGGAGGSGGDGCFECALSGASTADCELLVETCLQNTECASLALCMQSCSELDTSCQSECIELTPSAAAPLYAAFDCIACEGGDCSAECERICSGGCSELQNDCSGCINDPCAQTACSTATQACTESSGCLDFATCVNACQSDATCIDQCVVDEPLGAELYDDLIRCMLCTKPACWDVCSADQPNCAGFAG